MKKINRRTFIKALAGSAAVLGLDACGGGSPGASQMTGSDTSSAASEQESVAGAVLDIHFHSGNKYTLANEDGNLRPVFQKAADELGITVNSTANPVATNSLQEFELQATEKFPADIYGGSNIRQSVNSYATMGAFLPLNELIEEYAPNLKAFLEKNSEVRKSMTAADGNIYFLSYLPDGGVARVYFIRTDWLDKLGMEVPSTFDELENVLYAFRDQDVNGNGQKDELPVFNDKWQELIRLANLWGARVYGYDSYNERIVLNEKGEMYHAWIAPEFKEAMLGLNKWYKDGLIDPEVFSRKMNTSRQTLWTQTNVGGMTHDFPASTTNFNYNPELLSAVPDFKVQAFKPVCKNGQAFEENHRVVAKDDGWAISSQCKNPVAAIKYMDWFFSPEGRNAINFGIEGESYTMVDGKPTFTDEVLSQSNVYKYLQEEYGAQLPIGYAQDFGYEVQWTSKEGVEAFDLYNSGDVNYAQANPTLSFNDEEQEIYSKYISALNTYMDEEVTGFITGKLDVETEWDAYVAKCKELGADELVKIYHSAYLRYQKS